MEDEIDLREYVAVLLRHWRLIAGLAVVAALVAGGVSLAIPPTYQAMAVVSTSASGVPALALSDAVLEGAITELGADLPAALASPAALRARLTASQASGSTAVQLTAKDGDPQGAASLANALAQALIGYIRASTAASDSPAAMQAELDAQLSLLAELSSNRYSLEWAIEDAAALRERLAGHRSAEPALAADEAALFLLSLQTVAPAGAALQFPMAAESGRTVGDQIEYLDALLDSMQARHSVLQARAESLQAEIGATQARLAEAPASALGDSPVKIQLSQRAGVPAAAVSPRTAQNAALAGMLGLMLGVLAAFGMEWWRAPRPVLAEARVEGGHDASRA